MKKLLLFFLLLFLLCSCSPAQGLIEKENTLTQIVIVEVNTDTPEPTSTSLPTKTNTPNPTNTFTPMPTPVFTELGASAYQIASVLNWDVIICGDEIDQKSFEDGTVGYEDGIFPLTEDTGEYFCGFTGYQPEPVPEPAMTSLGVVGQVALSFFEYKQEKNGLVMTQYAINPIIMTKDYFPNPSAVKAKELFEKLIGGEFENINEYRKQEKYTPIPLKIWPLTEEELGKLRSDLSVGIILYTQ